MRTLLALLVLGASITLVPPASAQVAMADSMVTLRIAPLEGVVAHDATSVLPVEVRYTYSMTGVALAPTQIQLKIVDAPEWLVATISPATISMPVMTGTPGLGTTQTSPPQEARLLLSLASDAPAGETAIVRLVATAMPNGNIKGASAEEATPVRTSSESAVCAAVYEAAPAEDDVSDGELETATLGAAAGPSPWALAASAGAGAVAGLGLALRLRRR